MNTQMFYALDHGANALPTTRDARYSYFQAISLNEVPLIINTHPGSHYDGVMTTG